MAVGLLLGFAAVLYLHSRCPECQRRWATLMGTLNGGGPKSGVETLVGGRGV